MPSNKGEILVPKSIHDFLTQKASADLVEYLIFKTKGGFLSNRAMSILSDMINGQIHAQDKEDNKVFCARKISNDCYYIIDSLVIKNQDIPHVLLSSMPGKRAKEVFDADIFGDSLVKDTEELTNGSIRFQIEEDHVPYKKPSLQTRFKGFFYISFMMLKDLFKNPLIYDQRRFVIVLPLLYASALQILLQNLTATIVAFISSLLVTLCWTGNAAIQRHDERVTEIKRFIE